MSSLRRAALARVADLFGHRSDNLIMTLNWDYMSALRGKP